MKFLLLTIKILFARYFIDHTIWSLDYFHSLFEEKIDKIISLDKAVYIMDDFSTNLIKC